MVRQAPIICVMAPPIHLGAWSMALMLWLPFELLLVYWSDFVANLQRLNYRYPILRNIGRSYRSTDVANNQEKERLKYSRVHRANPVFTRAAKGTPRVFTGTHVIEDRTRPWHSYGLHSGLVGAQQCFSVSTEDHRSIAAV